MSGQVDDGAGRNPPDTGFWQSARGGWVMVYLLSIVAGCAGAITGALGFWIVGAVLIGMAGLPDAGGMAALAVLSPLGGLFGLLAGIVLTLRYRGGLRGRRELAIHAAAVLAAIGGLTGAAFNLQTSSLSHLGRLAHVPAVEFEIRLPDRPAAPARADVQVELRTDRNQALAQLDEAWQQTEDGRAILKGQVAISYRTAERTMVLNLPGEPQRVFRLRLSEQPKASAAFSPWHQPDSVTMPGEAEPRRATATDGFAIRYRVL